MANYFEHFDTIKYNFTIKSDNAPIIENITDLTQRTTLKISDSDLEKMCDKYIIQSGMTPEQVAASLYNNPTLHWTILYINNICNVNEEWPISEYELSKFVTKKYGSSFEYNTHHYEKMPEGIWMDSQFIIDTFGENPRLVTNYDYEYEKNEQKRYIKVIKPEYITAFTTSFE